MNAKSWCGARSWQKQLFGALTALALIIISSTGHFLAFAPQVAFADHQPNHDSGGDSPVYDIEITSSQITNQTVELSGTASSTKFAGQFSQYHVDIHWNGEATSTNVHNLATTTEDNFAGTWSGSHTFLSGGSKTITILLCHQSCTGAEGADASETITVVIPEPEPATGTIVIVKDVDDNSGESVTFDFTGDLGAFSLLGNGTDSESSEQTAGVYTVTESAEDGWNFSGVSCVENGDSSWDFDGASVTVTLVAGETVTCTFSNALDVVEPGSISGFKFEDINGDGTWSNTEPNVEEGVTISLFDGDTEVASATTDEFGDYSFTDVAPGTYGVCETVSEGWVQTSPSLYPEAASCRTVTVEDVDGGDEVVGINFGNFDLGSIGGFKFNDEDENGEWDNDESGLEGWIIELYDVDEDLLATTTTASDGSYSFSGLFAGVYSLLEQLQGSWEQTTDNPTPVAIISGTDETGVNFGNFLPPSDGAVTICKENELEEGLSGWEVSITDGELTFSGTTGDNGCVLVDEEVPFGAYTLSEVLQDGWENVSGNGTKVVVDDETETFTLINRLIPLGPALLTIVKETDGNDGEFDFQISGTNINFSDDTSVQTEDGVGTSTVFSLEEGTYTVNELALVHWDLESVSCTYSGDSYGVSIEGGEQVTAHDGDEIICTFVNVTNCGEDEHYDESASEGAGACVPNQGENFFDLSVAKDVEHDGTPAVGEQVTYTVTVSHTGAGAGSITVSDELPSGVGYVSHDTESGTYDPDTGVWSVSSLSGGTAVLTITVTINSGEEGQSIVNAASITGHDGEDTDAENDSAGASFTVESAGSGGGGGSTPPPEPTPPPGGGITGLGGGGPLVLGVSTTGGGQVLGESCGLYMDQHLRRGYTGNDAEQVAKLQEFLTEHGFASFAATGFFGPLTEDAVKDFQTTYANEILVPWNIAEPTGLVYLTTLRQVNLLECPELTLQIPELVPWSENPAFSGTVVLEAPATQRPENAASESTAEHAQEAAAVGAISDTDDDGESQRGKGGIWDGIWDGIFR